MVGGWVGVGKSKSVCAGSGSRSRGRPGYREGQGTCRGGESGGRTVTGPVSLTPPLPDCPGSGWDTGRDRRRGVRTPTDLPRVTDDPPTGKASETFTQRKTQARPPTTLDQRHRYPDFRDKGPTDSRSRVGIVHLRTETGTGTRGQSLGRRRTGQECEPLRDRRVSRTREKTKVGLFQEKTRMSSTLTWSG